MTFTLQLLNRCEMQKFLQMLVNPRENSVIFPFASLSAQRMENWTQKQKDCVSTYKHLGHCNFDLYFGKIKKKI